MWRAPPSGERSPWLAEALALEDGDVSTPPLVGEERADVCIVGGGYTGLWTALELKEREPSATVALLEAETCGAGASGANAGYLMNLWPKFLSLRKFAPTDEAVWLARASAEAVELVIRFCAEHGVDAEVRRDGWLWAASSPAQAGAWTETLDALARVGEHPFRQLTRDEAQSLTGSPTHEGGVLDPTCATVQPAKLVRGLRRAALRAGVRLHESSPMTGFEEKRRVIVRTGGGSVEAEHVVLAINAWAARFRSLRPFLVILASDTFLTTPIAHQLAELGWSQGPAVSDSRRRLNYCRTTRNGRLLFGKGGVGVAFGGRGATSMWGPSPRVPELLRHFQRTFPQLGAVPLACSWTAPVEYSVTSLPFFGLLPGSKRVSFATGYSGDGVGPSRLIARGLAALALGADDELRCSALARLPAGRLPPEPLRSIGGSLVAAACARVEAAEDRGLRPGWIVRQLASVDPTGFVG